MEGVNQLNVLKFYQVLAQVYADKENVEVEGTIYEKNK